MSLLETHGPIDRTPGIPGSDKNDDEDDDNDDDAGDVDDISPLPLFLHPAGLALHVSVLRTPVPHITPSHCNDDDDDCSFSIFTFLDCGLWSIRGKLSTFSTQAKGQGVGIGEQQNDQDEEEILRVEEQGML